MGVGVVAVWTFRDLKESALKSTEERVAAALSDKVIRARIDEVAFSHLRGKTAELEPGFDPNDQEER